MPLTLSAHAVEFLRILELDQRQRVVIGRHADLENADHMELFQARNHSGGGDLSLRRDEQHAVADMRTQRARQIDTEHDIEFARAQVAQIAFFHLVAESGQALFRVGQDAAHHHALHAFVQRYHALAVDIGRGGAHFRMLGDDFQYLLPIVQSARCRCMTCKCGVTPRMRARISFWKPFITDSTTISAITPRPMPSHGDHRDEGDEVVAALGAGITQADEEFVRLQSGSSKY